MKEVAKSEDLRRVEKQIMARSAANAFAHLTEADLRTYSMLRAAGLLKSGEDESQDMQRLRVILRDPKHPARVDVGPGPLVVISEGERRRSVISVGDLICVPDTGLRKAALGAIEALSEIHGSVLVRTANLLHENGSALRGRKGWTRASLAVQEAFDNDYCVLLLGLRQCVLANHLEGASDFLAKLLRPSLAALSGAWHEVVGSQAPNHDSGPSPRSVAGALDQFMHTSGHLILSETALLEALRRGDFLEGEKEKLWQEIWEWAESASSPLAWHHACLFYVNHRDVLPLGCEESMWERVSALLVARASSEEDQREEPLPLRAMVARHYCYYIESRLPGNESEKIATLAWWFAEKLLGTVEALPSDTARIEMAALRRALLKSHFEWSLLRPPSVGSPLRVATLCLSEPWSFALVAGLGESLGSWKPATLSEDQEEAISRRLVAMLVGGALLLDQVREVESEEVRGRILSAVTAWANAVTSDSLKSGMKALIDFAVVVFSEENLAEMIRHFPEAEEHVQSATAQALKVATWSGRGVSSLLWPHVKDEGWFQDACTQADGAVVDSLFDSLLEIQSRENLEWRVALPHLLASVVERKQPSGDRLELLVGLVVISSVSGQTVSGVRRLVNQDSSDGIRRSLWRWRERLQRVQDESVPWLASRVGPVLAALDEI